MHHSSCDWITHSRYQKTNTMINSDANPRTMLINHNYCTTGHLQRFPVSETGCTNKAIDQTITGEVCIQSHWISASHFNETGSIRSSQIQRVHEVQRSFRRPRRARSRITENEDGWLRASGVNWITETLQTAAVMWSILINTGGCVQWFWYTSVLVSLEDSWRIAKNLEEFERTRKDLKERMSILKGLT